MRGWLSLRERLAVVACIGMLPLVIAFVWAAMRAQDDAARESQARLETVAALLAARHDAALQAAEQFLAAVAAVPDLAGPDAGRCGAYLDSLRTRPVAYRDIAVVTPDGQSLCGAPPNGAASARHVREAVAQRRFAVGEASGPSAQPTIPFAMPVMVGGEVRAVVVASLPWNAAVLGEHRLPPAAVVAVSDPQGRTVLRTGAPAAANLPSPPEMLAAVAPVRPVGSLAWRVHVSVPRQEAAIPQVAGDLLPFIAAGLLLGLGMTFSLGERLIVRPAKQLLGTVKRLERGRLDARVPLVSVGSRGEFARIAAAFNLMADSLQVRQADLQNELTRSQRAYDLLDVVLNSLHEGILAVSATGQFLLHNDAAARLLPLEDAPRLPELWPEHFGMFHADGVTPYTADELPMVRSALGESASEVPVFLRNALVPEGRRLQCSWRPISEERGIRGGVVVLTDVTELQRLQAAQALQVEELHDMQRKLMEAQRLARIGHWEADVTTGRLWWSAEASALLGAAPGALDGTLAVLAERIHPEDRAMVEPANAAALRDGAPLDLEFRVLKPQGVVVWIHATGGLRRDAQGAPAWFGGLVQDITLRKRAEEERAQLFSRIRELNASLEERIVQRTAELAAQERLYRTLAEQAPEVVWNTDRMGSVTFLNRAWYELVGGVPADWQGTGWVQQVHPDDREELRRNWERSRETLQPFTGTRRILSRAGVYHTMAYKASPVLDDDGEVSFWVGIDSDITELKAIENALRQSNQELEAFSYSVSHDLRAPLGAIGGFSRALEHRLPGPLDEKVAHYLARIQAGVEKMEQLIDALLSLSRVVRAPVHWEEVDLAAMARDTLEGFAMQHPDRQVEAVIQDPLTARGDSRLLRALMENLVGNAWKFTSRTEGARVEVGRSGDAFFVRDNGVGFDMAYAGKLFSAFQRLHTDAEFPGTGIGLATVRRIVARHQGSVWAESEPGRGTTFYFKLSEE